MGAAGGKRFVLFKKSFPKPRIDGILDSKGAHQIVRAVVLKLSLRPWGGPTLLAALESLGQLCWQHGSSQRSWLHLSLQPLKPLRDIDQKPSPAVASKMESSQ
jgi:hypothetical protein